jgi:hypothetical protein
MDNTYLEQLNFINLLKYIHNEINTVLEEQCNPIELNHIL